MVIKLIPKKLAQITELKKDTIIVDNKSTNRFELRDQITRLLIKNPLSLDKFLNPEKRTIVNKDKDIFITVINNYTIATIVKEKESSNKKEIKKVNIAKALRAIKTVKI